MEIVISIMYRIKAGWEPKDIVIKVTDTFKKFV